LIATIEQASVLRSLGQLAVRDLTNLQTLLRDLLAEKAARTHKLDTHFLAHALFGVRTFWRTFWKEPNNVKVLALPNRPNS
jgi:uncharacterized membrane protein